MTPRYELGVQQLFATVRLLNSKATLIWSSLRWHTALPSVIFGYLVVCHMLRYRRMKLMHLKYYYPTKASLGKMTATDAQAIQQYLTVLEFPAIYGLSLGYALFKTYGIPTISSLLARTGYLASTSPRVLSRRTVDTAVLLSEIALNPPTSARAISGIARLNYLHNRYRRQGLISNADMLYTLSLFTLEPARWIDRYEWRKLSLMERCAIGVFWKSLGDAMEIDYAVLKLGNAKTRWVDALEWMDDLQKWSTKYEEEHMKLAESNRIIADATMFYRIHRLPKFLQKHGSGMLNSLMEKRLRVAIMVEDPPNIYRSILDTLWATRKYYLKYLSLPRFAPIELISSPDQKTGRAFYLRPVPYPWYKKATLFSRWEPSAIRKRFGGIPVPGGDDGSAYNSEGYLIEDVGPAILVGKGKLEMAENRRVLQQTGRGGCPFEF